MTNPIDLLRLICWLWRPIQDILELLAIPYRPQRLLKAWPISQTVPSHSPSTAERQHQKQSVCCLWQLFVSTFNSLCNTLVWPHLQHAMQESSQNLIADADCLEQIQRLTIRPIKGFHRLPYEERLRPPWRPHSRIQCVSLRIGSWPQPLFYSASATRLERSTF